MNSMLGSPAVNSCGLGSNGSADFVPESSCTNLRCAANVSSRLRAELCNGTAGVVTSTRMPALLVALGSLLILTTEVAISSK
jgi:hypothetical protein